MPTSISSVVTRFTYRKKGINAHIKSASDLAQDYREKFGENEDINTKMITTRLIEKFRSKYVNLLEQLENIKDDQSTVQINKNEIEKFEKGELDDKAFASIARSVGREVRNNFAKRCGTKIWSKITKHIS